MPFKMDLNIKEEVDDKSFILQNSQNEFEESKIELKKPKIELFQCEDCSEQFQIFDLYELHKTIHGTMKVCPHCKRTVVKGSTFVKHIKDHIKNYIMCEYCPKIFFKKQIYSNHRKLHTRSEKKFQCTYCEKSLFTEKELSVHVRCHTGEPPYKCNDCDKTFNLFDLYELHKMVHGTEKICPHCKRTIVKRSSFIEHIEDHIKNYIQCEYCPKIFFGRQIYVTHRRWHRRAERNFQCTYCNKRFLTDKDLSIHVRFHTEKPPFKCDHCDKTFSCLSALRTHYQRIDVGNFPCDACDGTFRSAFRLKSHKTRMHDNGRKMPCKLCGLDFLNLNSFLEHRQQQHPDYYRRKCQLCNLEFVSKNKYTLHRKMHEESGNPLPPAKRTTLTEMAKLNQIKRKRSCRCFLCGNILDWTQLKQHQDSTHMEKMYDEVGGCGESSAYRCKECGEVSTTKRKALFHLDEHMKKTHTCKHPDCHAVPSMTYIGYTRHRFKFHKAIVKCEDCKRQYTPAGLAKHREPGYCRMMVRNRVKPSKCNHCGRIIMGVKQMRIHIKNEHTPTTDQKTTGQCNICNVRFETKETYEDHMKAQHGPQCHKCKRNFSSVAALQRHVQRNVCHRGYMKRGYVRKDAHKNIPCPYCSRSFVNQQDLSIHVRYHTEEAPYKCDHCDETFERINFLRVHLLRTHDGANPFVCDVCDGSFSHVSSLNVHKKIHDLGRKFTCRLCGLDFLNRKTYYAHLRQHYPQPVAPRVRSKVYYRKCHLCNLEFVSKHKYCLHRKMHKENGTPLPIAKPMKAAQMEKPKETKRKKRKQTLPKNRRCFLCGDFVNVAQMKQHQDSTHMETMYDEVGKCGLSSAYRCKECGYVSTSKIQALRHLDEHMKKTHICDQPDCHAVPAMTYMGYTWHRFKFHSTVTCDDCKRQFTTKGGLTHHRLSGYCPVIASKSTKMDKRALSPIATEHSPGTDQKTTGQYSICNDTPLPIAKRMKAAQMEKPKETQKEKPNQTLLKRRRCFLCGDLVHETQLQQHQDSTHMETMYDEVGECGLSSSYRCKECGNVSTSKKQALRHLDKHMKKTHTCKYPDCHAVPAMTYMGYTRHRFKLHSTVTCDDCKRQFTSKGALTLHRLSGYCPVIASKSTKMDKLALSHVATERSPETDQKTPGQCSICNERFETKKDYDDHMKKQHGAQYVCPKCKRNFTSAFACQKHVKKELCTKRWKDAGQNEDGVTVMQDVFCKYCACCLSGVTMMILHLEDHHPDEDKYVCLICEKTFKNFALHMSHRKEHPENRLRRVKYVVQLKEVICGTELKRDPVDDNFVDVPEHVVVQQDGEVLSDGDQ